MYVEVEKQGVKRGDGASEYKKGDDAHAYKTRHHRLSLIYHNLPE